MKTHNKTGQVRILEESFTVEITYAYDCDDNIEIYAALLDTGMQVLDIVDTWLFTEYMVQLLEDIIHD